MLATRIMGHTLHICRSHFYKVLVLVILGLMALQYGLSVAFYGGKSYFPVAYPLSLYNGGGGTTTTTTTAAPARAVPGTNVTSFARSELLTNRTSVVAVSVSLGLAEARGANGSLGELARVTGATVLGSPGDVRNGTLLAAVTTVVVELSPCPAVPPKLVGPVKVLADSPPMLELEKQHPELELGGRFRPKDCKSKHRVAIIIPYRDREDHLKMFLYNLHPVLQRQQIDYGIFVVEEAGDTKFNRAMLMNIGFVESLKMYEWQCFIFHDVDLLPEDDRNIYSCPEQPRHMSVAVNTMGYKLPYNDIFGGVSALTRKQMETVNGFSNEFWGWGGEDDDMSNRIRFYGYKISRYSPKIARYRMMKHTKDKPNPDRYNKLYKGKLRYKTDGINSLKYHVEEVVLKRLYTWVLVKIEPPPK